jgi:hypothetical protein
MTGEGAAPDRRPRGVEVRLDDQRLAVTFDAERAREQARAFAHQLGEAARYADEGDQEGDR